QSQMSLWSIMNSPLAATNDVRNMNEATRHILMNEEVIALNQDALGRQAKRVIHNDDWSVFIKPLENGDHAIAVLNRQKESKAFSIDFKALGLEGRYEVRDLWQHKNLGRKKSWK